MLFPNEYQRDGWVAKTLATIQNAKILDAGCGTQRYKKHCNHLEYYGQDFGEYIPKEHTEGLQMDTWEYGKLDYVGNIWEIKEKDNFFDAILCTEVLEHIPYPNETIKEFSRLMKPGAQLILTAPFASLPHFQPYYYYSGFSKEWYMFILEKNGFEIIEITPNGNFFIFLVQENLRGLKLINNPLLKIVYGIFLVPKVFIDFLLSKINKNYQLVFGYHVLARKNAK
jgi:ubiquinone/menaquinone biosynthesis C-methylase UbiE